MEEIVTTEDNSVPSIDILDDYSLSYVLSLLSFSDKVRLERVCKRWQHYMYRDQNELIINRWTVYGSCLNELRRRYRCRERKGLIGVEVKPLKSVLRKCPHITDVSLNICFSGTILPLIGQYCSGLRVLSCDLLGIKARPFINFGRQFGYRLESVQFQVRNRHILAKEFLIHCRNVKSVPKLMRKSVFISEEQDFLPKLENVFSFIMMANELPEMSTLTERYGQTMKKFEVCLFKPTEDILKSAISHLCRLKNLEFLRLTMYSMEEQYIQPLDQMVTDMSKSMTKLKNFQLTIDRGFVVKETLFQVLSLFTALEHLSVTLFGRKNLTGSLDLFRHCPRLRCLEIYGTETKVSPDFLRVTSKQPILPRLHFIKMTTNYEITDDIVESMSKTLESLEAVVITEKWPQRHELYFGKSLKRKLFEDPFSVHLLVYGKCGISEF